MAQQLDPSNAFEVAKLKARAVSFRALRAPAAFGWLAAPAAIALAASVWGCSGSAMSVAPSIPIAPAPPPKDDGKPAEGGTGGSAHAAALEELKVAPLGFGVDKQNSVRILLPDPAHWTRVKFWGVPTLVGFRYGKDHHAIVAAFVTHVEDNEAPNACRKSFEDMAMPVVDSFEVELLHDSPASVVWNGKLADIDSVFAKTATLAARDSYAAAYGTYPAWRGACLVVGVAVPSREDVTRAREVRDRFAREVLPFVIVTAREEPRNRY